MSPVDEGWIVMAEAVRTYRRSTSWFHERVRRGAIRRRYAAVGGYRRAVLRIEDVDAEVAKSPRGGWKVGANGATPATRQRDALARQRSARIPAVGEYVDVHAVEITRAETTERGHRNGPRRGRIVAHVAGRRFALVEFGGYRECVFYDQMALVQQMAPVREGRSDVG